MAYLRILYDNAASRAAITASSTAGGLVAGNMLTQVKTEVWRSTSTTCSLTLTWPTAEYVNCIALPFCNLSSAGTIRVRGYTNTSDTVTVFDTTALAVCSDLIDNIEWGEGDLGVNAFAFGGATYAVSWFDNSLIKKLVIDIDDSSSANTYFESANLVVGKYWSPLSGCEYGASVTNQESSTQSRSDAGDLYTDRGCMYKVLSFDTTYMSSQDKTRMWQTFRNNGMHTPLFVSIIPEADEPTDEQIYQVYGKLSKSMSIKFKFLNQFDASIEIEEL